ncbi:hypothetical protein K456DRAFT_1905366 [Colletotrichum gloeosporioides 23]|nr:hypothetical protein K456DRAFT_1905366 [Colletotrichum gloeosporioides 23]
MTNSSHTSLDLFVTGFVVLQLNTLEDLRSRDATLKPSPGAEDMLKTSEMNKNAVKKTGLLDTGCLKSNPSDQSVWINQAGEGSGASISTIPWNFIDVRHHICALSMCLIFETTKVYTAYTGTHLAAMKVNVCDQVRKPASRILGHQV